MGRKHTSTSRRATAAAAAVLAVTMWLAAVLVWTVTTRVTDPSGFAEVTVEVIQSPAGSVAVTDALLATVDSFGAGQGIDLTTAAHDEMSAHLSAALQSAEFPGLMGPAIERMREAYQAAPDQPVTIDFSAIRPVVEQKVRQVNPALVVAIPPGEDLRITVEKRDVPAWVETVVGAADTLRSLPLWLLLGVIGLGAAAVAAAGDRVRMLRVLGIASLAIAIIPLLLRLVMPPISVSAIAADDAGDVAWTATVAILGNWWIALITCLVVGAVLLGTGIVRRRRSAPRRGPIVLGR